MPPNDGKRRDPSVNVRYRTTTVLFPSATVKERLTRRRMIPALARLIPQKETSSEHTASISALKERRTRYVVHHGNRSRSRSLVPDAVPRRRR